MPAPLLALVLDHIACHGPMTVAEYVDLALYHPTFGYYAGAGRRSGRAGDFITSVDLGPTFGRLLATEFAEMAHRLGDGTPVDLVEVGAGDGRLARDVLDHLAATDPAAYSAIRLHLVDRSPTARAAHAATLGAHRHRLVSSSDDMPNGIAGIIYANELLDAMPPHLVVTRTDGLREVYVDAAGGRLVTREAPPSTPRLAEYLDRVGVNPPPGRHLEINLAAVDWMRRAGKCLARGYLVVIDYGHRADELFSDARPAGTLTAYWQHTSEARDADAGWLEHPGDRDLTSHVDLTTARQAAEEAGLYTLGVLDQGYFLLSLAQVGSVGSVSRLVGGVGDRRALKTLVLPGGLGSTHKVMVFGRRVDAVALTGLSGVTRLT